MPQRATRKGATPAKRDPKRKKSEKSPPQGKPQPAASTTDAASAAGGRPPKYRHEYAALAEKACSTFGATDAELATFLGVCERTINNWKAEYPEFKEALDAGKGAADQIVERSLFERARGYNHKAVKIMQYEGAPLVVDYVEHYPPEVEACKYWLNNRQPERWRSKVVHVGGDPGEDQPVQMQHEMSPEVKEAMARVSLRVKNFAATGPK